MYVIALLLALYLMKFFVKKFNLDIDNRHLDNYFIWTELGVILGARPGYISVYDLHTLYYLMHPWQIFNPLDINGEFVGIRDMSHHGVIVGSLLATFLFCKKYKQRLWLYLDVVVLSVLLAYILGRVGNSLNQKPFGHVSDVAWGIYVDGLLRHPSQLYEAFLEGVVIFIVVYLFKLRQRSEGELTTIYVGAYSLARFVCELYREPDFGIDFVVFGLNMGQISSLITSVVVLLFYLFFKKNLAHLKG